MQMTIVQLNLLITASIYAPINGNPAGRGNAGKGGFDAWDYLPCRAFHHAKRPRGRDIWLWPTEGWYLIQSLPRGFLKVTLQLEKGMKFLFVLIAIIRYFKLSSKQILSILRKFLSSSCHLIVKLRLKSNSTIKVRGLFTGHWSDLFRHVEQIFIKQ